MKNIILSMAVALAAITSTTPAEASPSLAICHNPYALCASSATVAVPGKTVTVNGNVFPMGISVCPVLKGESIADLSLMGGSCKAPKGKVWSLFSNAKTYPVAPSWNPVTVTNRFFTSTAKPGGGFSNMWSMICTVRPMPVNGATLADCVGPMNESPWTSTTVPPGAKIGTAAPHGFPNPVGGNFP